jgi:hypothetical protein
MKAQAMKNIIYTSIIMLLCCTVGCSEEVVDARTGGKQNTGGGQDENKTDDPSSISYSKIVTPPTIPSIDESDYAAYYVDNVNGNDTNDGRSESAPFKTFAPILDLVRAGMPPKTKVLLRSGCTFTENLVLKNLSGTTTKPFILDSYGGIERPTISASSGDAVLIQDDNMRFRNIRITNKTGSRGICIQAQFKGGGAFRNVEITGCRIEEVNWAGNANVEGANPANIDVEAIAPGAKFSTKEFGGIILEPTINTALQGPYWYENIFITNNEIRKVCRSGILITGKWGSREPGKGSNLYDSDSGSWYPNRNIVVQGNDFNYIGGDAVIMMSSTDSYIDHNRCFNANFLGRNGQASAGLWPYSCSNIVMQYNEVGYTWLAHSSSDGEGLDVDFACKNTLVQYNYVHHNEGGGILLCNNAGGSEHSGTVIRNNVFYNNKGSYRGSLMTVSGNVSNVEVYNNIILQTIATTNFLLSDNWPNSGKSTNVRFRNNIFTSSIPASIAFVFNNMENPKFENNLFYQVGSIYTNDATSLRYDPKITPPASADGYSKALQFRPAEAKVFQDGLLFDGMLEKDLAGNVAEGATYVGPFAK